MSIIFSVFKFNLLRLFRNFKSSGIMFILPIVFMGVFALAFGQSTQLSFSTGIFISEDVKSYAPDFKKILSDISNDEKEIEMKLSEYASEDILKSDIREGKVDSGISVTKREISAPSELPFQVAIIVKETDNNTLPITAILQNVAYGTTVSQSPVDVQSLNKNAGEAVSVFNILAPGLMIYGLLILIPGIAETFTSITEKNYVFRILNSKATSSEIIAGSVLYYLVISVIQLLILYLTASLFGYNATGSVFIALIPGLLTAVFAIGLGILIGSFSRRVDTATNLGTMVSIVLGFFSGSFINGIGKVFEFELWGRIWQFNDLIPSKWGTVAIEKILTENKGIADIQTELLILAISGIVLLALSIVVYQKRQLAVRS